MRRTLLGLGCAVVLAAAASPVSYATDRPEQRAGDRGHDDDERDDDRDGKRRRPEWQFKRVGTFANFRNAGLGNLTVSEIITSTGSSRVVGA